MSVFLLDAATNTTVSTENVGSIFDSLRAIFTLLVTFMGDAVDTIQQTPLLFVPIILAFAGGLVVLAISVIRRMGVRGGGRGRRRHR